MHSPWLKVGHSNVRQNAQFIKQASIAFLSNRRVCLVEQVYCIYEFNETKLLIGLYFGKVHEKILRSGRK